MNEQNLQRASEKSGSVKRFLNRRFRQLMLGAAASCLLTGAAAGYLISERRASAEKTFNIAATPEALSASFAEVASRVESSVVNIDTKTNAPEAAANGKKQTSQKNESEDEDSSILEYFRKQLPARPSYSVGSGFIVDAKGYILTNYHVIEDTNKITVRLQSGEEFIADVVGTDEETDVAVLKVNAGRELPAVKLGDSNEAKVGDWVLAIGSPFGLDQTVTAGIISQVGRETPYATSFQKFIQTDAAINRGNSGGPLVNMNGEVVGINSQIATSTGDYNGIGFALPSSQAIYVYQQILQNGKVRRGYLGVTLDSVKTEFAKIYNLPEAKGAIITDVRGEKGSAALAGLRENDVILKFNNAIVANAQDLIAKVAETAPNQKVPVVYLRENGDKLEQLTAELLLGERPILREGKVLRPKVEKPIVRNAQQLGLTLTDLTAQLASQNKLNGQKGILVKEIDPNGIIADVKSAGRESAVSKNDLIVRINRTPIKNVTEFNAITDKLKTGDAVVLHVASYDAANRKIQTRIVQFTFQ